MEAGGRRGWGGTQGGRGGGGYRNSVPLLLSSKNQSLILEKKQECMQASHKLMINQEHECSYEGKQWRKFSSQIS